jgi:tetratricopeptide (TPR) repeat protein
MLLDSGPAVSLLIDRVNRLLDQATIIPEEQAMAAAFQGINGRALYVVGAHMARTIDRELGREALVATVAAGPRSFIRAYNSVADESQRIREIREPDELSASQALRLAAVEDEFGLVEDTLGQIEREHPAEPGGALFDDLMSAGLVLLEKGQSELGVRTFELLVALFPDHPFSHLNLAEACGGQGDTDCERESYAQAIQLDSRLAALVR